MSKWIEQGTCNQRPGETLVAIEQEGFGIVCAVLDYEGESVYRILRAMNSHDELLEALRMFVSLDPRCHHGVDHCGECAACLGQAAISKAEGRTP